MKDDFVAARVVARERTASAVVSLRLASEVAGASLPAREAGAHIDVHLRDGLSRKHSLCSDPGFCGRAGFMSALEAIAVATSCEAGLCDACRSTVIAGVPDHRDTFLSSAKN
ncbi:hypothetical protein WKR88_18665 [Trinickia caryophylli]|uniref:Uncharacterized protein n=1 Tax=Trinickia caryophylli TaxID=28094 RepID=A0A1X7DHQ5_TRICW|nr:hypothetical protein [Trinickia caryophylli]WQE12261.1 hypothetical protein U0034_02225 [Trinickia caryophylli]GLU31597.1 hypothetical protein Busp01_14390 [Trinickia caryophylli]SMF15633.1 hypothetical protein SAMN06295900_103227 [Trinickia caryophylli]